MESCPNFNANKGADFLRSNLSMSDLQSWTNCPNPRGGRRKRKQKIMKGGNYFTRRNIKIALYVILAGLIALGMTGRTTSSVLMEGLGMLSRGECGFVANRLWSIFGLENPVCAVYNSMVNTVIMALYQGNSNAIATLIGEAMLVIGTPVVLARSIDSIAGTLESQMVSQFGPPLLAIENGQATAALMQGPVQEHVEVEQDNRPLSARVNGPLNASRGGKRTTRRMRKMGGRKCMGGTTKKMHGGKKRTSTRRRKTRRY